MAQDAVNINILSNVREAVRGVDDVADAVDQVGDRLKDASKNSQSSTDKMERDFRDLTKSADASADALKDKFRDAYRSIERQADSTADTVVQSQRRMGERSQEVGQEIRQNLGEGIANAARGDFAALSDTIGDTLGGAVAGIGGIGFAAAGAAGALGLGVLVAAFQGIQAESEATEQRVSDMYDRLSENAAAFISRSQIAEAIGNLSQEEIVKGIEKATSLQLDQSDVLQAMVGDTQSIADLYSVMAQRKADEVQAIKDSGLGLEDQATKIEAANVKYAESTDWLRQIQDDTTGAAARWTAVQDAVRAANGDIDTLSANIAGIPNPSVVLKIDDSAIADTWYRLQQRAEEGITVKVIPGAGRFWE